jgi:hypothetical protein
LDSSLDGARAKTIFDEREMLSLGVLCKEYLKKYPTCRVLCYARGMKMVLDRAILTVGFADGLWAVEHDGEFFGQSPDKEIAKAAANRQARAMQDSGRPCQVRVRGENGFWVA